MCSVAILVMNRKYIATHSDFSSTAEVLDTVTGSCSKVQRTPGMRIDGLVEGMPFELKIDICAMIIFIIGDLCNHFPPEYIPVLVHVRKKFETTDGSVLKTIGIVKIRLILWICGCLFSSVCERDLVQLFCDKSVNGLSQSKVELCTRVGLSSLVVSVEHVHSTVRHENVL